MLYALALLIMSNIGAFGINNWGIYNLFSIQPNRLKIVQILLT